MTIRSATVDDAERLLEIYAYYVEHTAISFEYDVPSLEEFRSRVANTLKAYPYLVVEEGGAIRGYACAHPFVGRKAYERSAELTIYLAREAKGRGYGRSLYGELERLLKEKGITNLYACIGDPIEPDEYLTHDSEAFHQRMGFVRVGTFHKCGYKFNRWYNMIWMEKIIGSYD